MPRILVIVFASSLVCVAQTYKMVWYHPYEGTLLASLADDRGPRASLVKSLDQNFRRIKELLGANAIIVRLLDEADYPGEGGGGMAYNPTVDKSKSQFAVGQEIILAIAQKWGLKVFFTIEPAGYHRYISDADPGGATGGYDFIDALIDPSAYYGALSTTQLPLVGLPDSSLHSYIDDRRVAGWIFGTEWYLPGNPAVNSKYLLKYWPYFYRMVHRNGSAGNAMIYVPGDLSDMDGQIRGIHELKQFFGQHSLPLPDMFGIEWYGNGHYNLANVATDLTTAVNAAIQADPVHYPGDVSLDPATVFLAEGGTDQPDQSALNVFYAQAVYTAAQLGVGGIAAWSTETYWNSYLNTWPLVPADSGGCSTSRPARRTRSVRGEVAGGLVQQNPDGTYATNPNVALFSATYTPAFSNVYAGAPEGYWDPVENSPLTEYDPGYWAHHTLICPTSSGTLSYNAVTPRGQVLAEAFANGADTYFYSNPGPIEDSGTGLAATTLYFSTNAATSVDIRVGSATGNLLCHVDAAIGSCATPEMVSNGMTFYMVDHTSNAIIATTQVYVLNIRVRKERA